MKNLYKKLLKEIKKYDNIYIARHIGADPDALGSQLALKEIIKSKYPSKDVYAIGAPASRFKFMGVLDRCEDICENSMLIVLDTPDIKRIDVQDLSKFKFIAKIDHHPEVDDYSNLKLIDDSASSTCQMILEMVLILNIKISDNLARLLYIGIVGDTDRFLHDYTSIKTFNLITKMLNKTNFKFTSIYEPLYTKPLAEVKFQGYIYQNLTITENGVAYVKITDDLLKEFNVDSASAGNMVNSLNYINEVVVWVLLTEDVKSNLIRVNLRSRGPYINEIATRFGGGGHKYASGARLTSWKQAEDLIEELDRLLKDYKSKE